jgi:hypothetical protein
MDGGGGVGSQVLPGPGEEFGRDDPVLVALGNEDGQSCQPPGRDRDPGLERQGAVKDGSACVAAWILQDQPAGKGGAPAEAHQDDGPAGGRVVIEPAPEPGHLFSQRLGRGTADPAVRKPCVAASLRYGCPDCSVGKCFREMGGQAEDFALIGAPPVQQHHQGCGRVG